MCLKVVARSYGVCLTFEVGHSTELLQVVPTLFAIVLGAAFGGLVALHVLRCCSLVPMHGRIWHCAMANGSGCSSCVASHGTEQRLVFPTLRVVWFWHAYRGRVAQWRIPLARRAIPPYVCYHAQDTAARSRELRDRWLTLPPLLGLGQVAYASGGAFAPVTLLMCERWLTLPYSFTQWRQCEVKKYNAVCHTLTSSGYLSVSATWLQLIDYLTIKIP